MGGVLALNKRSCDGRDVWCTHLAVNPAGDRPTRSKSMVAASEYENARQRRGLRRPGPMDRLTLTAIVREIGFWL